MVAPTMRTASLIQQQGVMNATILKSTARQFAESVGKIILLKKRREKMFNPNLWKEKAKIAAKLLPELLESRRTKNEIASILGVSERSARAFVSNVAKKMPILSHSRAIGYKKFENDEDIENAIATVMESRSRRKELMEREKPLLKALKQRGIKL